MQGVSKSDTSRTLLAIQAHPDDERYTFAGTLLKCRRELGPGFRAVILCATKGEAGIKPPFRPGCREGEMLSAAKILGTELRFLGYRNGEMIRLLGPVRGRKWRHERELGSAAVRVHPPHDSPEYVLRYNETIQALLSLISPSVPDAEMHSSSCWLAGLEEKIVGAIRGLRPAVVLALEPFGWSGHNEHLMISHAGALAYFMAGDESAFPGHLSRGLQPWSTPKLYYVCRGTMECEDAVPFPEWRDTVRRLAQEREALGVPPFPPSLRIDVSEYVEEKFQAALCHKSQATSLESVAVSRGAERGLFDGVYTES